MLSKAEVADLIARLSRVAVEGVSHGEAPSLVGALREADVALALRLREPSTPEIHSNTNEDEFISLERAMGMTGLGRRWFFRNKSKLSFIRTVNKRRVIIHLPSLTNWLNSRST